MNFNEPLATQRFCKAARMGDEGRGRVRVAVVTRMRQGVKGNKM